MKTRANDNEVNLKFSDIAIAKDERNTKYGYFSNLNQLSTPYVKDFDDPSINAANYKIGTYPETGWTQDYARKAVRFERMLELGMEGHRFFDLVRWGVADQVLNAYLLKEKERRSYKKSSGGFTKGKNEYYPIPNRVIEIAKVAGNTLAQNPQY